MTKLVHENVIEEMNRVFNADATLIYTIKQSEAGFNFESPLVIGVDQNFQKKYEQNYWHIDPFINEAIDSDQSVLGCSYNYSQDKWFDLQYYKKFLQPQNLDHELAVYIRENSKIIGGMATLRSKGHPPFEENDLANAKLLLPFIKQIVHNFHNGIEFHNRQAQTNFEFSDQGILLLDADLNIVGYNPSGMECFLSLHEQSAGMQHCLDKHSLCIPPEIMQDCQEMKRLFDNKLYFACIPRRRKFVDKRNKIVDTTCNIISRCVDNGSDYFLLISYSSSLNVAYFDIDQIRKQEKLTTRELHIAQLTAIGYTNRQIAENLCVSPFTIENHLKHIFVKIKVKNRTDTAIPAEVSLSCD